HSALSTHHSPPTGLPVVRRSCAACTIGCEHIYASPDGEVRLEYESLFALGPLCGVGDRAAVLQAVRACDDWGLDTISTGACIAFAMECCEKGLLDECGVRNGEFGILADLRFGNATAMLSLIEQIGRREGLGDLLAQGTRQAAAIIGGDAPDFAPH